MKKPILFLGAMILSCFMMDTAYAGDLNEHELAIIEAAKEVYEYDGKSYRADQKYIDQLISYLLRDDIDVNAADKDFIIQTAYNSIEIGIRDGYLKPIDHQNGQGEYKDNTGANVIDTIKEVLESVGKDISDVGDYIPLLIDGTDSQEIPADTSEHIDSYTDLTDTTDTNNLDSHTGKADDKKISVNTPIQATDGNHGTGDVNEINSIGTYMNADDHRMEDGIIKQTGFNMNRTLYIFIGIGILMIAGIYVTIKNNYFAHAYE